MFLRSLEITGFKSFADKTRLIFEPGIIAMVGPNGCGKSNVSDAIRWALGEQRPTAIRGSAMTDIIFNGTEERKPVNMAEVSITFADCEDKLGTEYNEITITRRVFRTGEGQCFINKTPCRLRDIRRLFMGTGIGTASYSVMAQGQIDAILSSRPEDRRVIFEEASGITRFRADRREAMRKLEQTDANLIRVDDIIRELQRQIGSLQRQAAKARRYKTLRAELRKFELFSAACRLETISKTSNRLNSELAALKNTVAARHKAVEAAENKNAEAGNALVAAERAIGAAAEAAAGAKAQYDAMSNAISVNLQRIKEHTEWAERDGKEAAETAAAAECQKHRLAEETERAADLRKNSEETLAQLKTAQEKFDALREKNAAARAVTDRIRVESAELERVCARLRDELASAERRTRDNVLKIERLSAEKDRLKNSISGLEAKTAVISGEHEASEKLTKTHLSDMKTAETRLAELRTVLSECEKDESNLRIRLKGLEEQIKVFSDRTKNKPFYPSGNTMISDSGDQLGIDPDSVIGYAAEHISAPPEYRKALETAMRLWNTALIMRSGDDVRSASIRLLKAGGDAGASLYAAPNTPDAAPEIPKGAVRLSEKVKCDARFRLFTDNILGRVCVVDSISDVDFGKYACIFVTRDGAALFSSGKAEIRMPEGGASDPLHDHMQAEDAMAEIKVLKEKLEKAAEKRETFRLKTEDAEKKVRAARTLLEQSLRNAARKEGEERALKRELAAAKIEMTRISESLSKLSNSPQNDTDQIKKLSSRISESVKKRESLAAALSAQAENIKINEEKFLKAQAGLAEARLENANLSQSIDNAESRKAAAEARVSELEKMLRTRLESVALRKSTIEKLKTENTERESELAGFKSSAEMKISEAEALKNSRAERQAALEASEKKLKSSRAELDAAAEKATAMELEAERVRMSGQNILDRLLNDWNITPEEFAREPEPEWGAHRPTAEEAVSKARELRAKLENIGPVNLIAIDEYQKIEERRVFLAEQKTDLSNAKTKLLSLIKKMDSESTEMFKETFEKANENFRTTFSRLFGGGSAQLRLLDDDILESGVDVIARPPGKKQQPINLLSGGERTLTAVALLFALYMIKPSPFALLDELDAALDESNIERFSGVLKDFLDVSQFVIITHNPHTIANADIVYGITQQEKGISKVVSMRMKRLGGEASCGEDPAKTAAKACKEKNEPPPDAAGKQQ